MHVLQLLLRKGRQHELVLAHRHFGERQRNLPVAQIQETASVDDGVELAIRDDDVTDLAEIGAVGADDLVILEVVEADVPGLPARGGQAHRPRIRVVGGARTGRTRAARDGR